MKQTYGYHFYYISGTSHDLIETIPNMFANLYLLHMKTLTLIVEQTTVNCEICRSSYNTKRVIRYMPQTVYIKFYMV